MEKQQVDFVIKQYIKPLYGFAYQKTRDTHQAEELSSRIIAEVYKSLLQREDIEDIRAYIYKIARNIYAKYCGELTKWRRNQDIEEIPLEAEACLEEEMLKSESYRLLRREILYLSEQRRKIVMAYYYENKKIAEIAQCFAMAEGTIKWHLFECKKELKTGMESIRTIGNLGLNPIRLSGLGHDGSPGDKGETDYFLEKSLTQNIAYFCYYQPHTISEIADELGVSPIFIGDELKTLVEYGFVDALPNDRYQTHVLIKEDSREREIQIAERLTYYGKVLGDTYFAELLEKKAEMEALPIYYPDRDFNFLLWSLIVYACQKFCISGEKKIKMEDVAVRRPDGGHYIAMATRSPSGKEEEYLPEWKSFRGYMIRNNSQLFGIKANVYWSNSGKSWKTNTLEDYKLLHHFLCGELPQNARNMDAYELLIDKGYLTKTEKGFQANIVYLPDRETKRKLDNILGELSPELLDLAQKLEHEIFQLQIVGQPKHMHKTIQYQCQNSLLASAYVFVMQYFLQKGILQLPTEEQRKQICNILIAGEGTEEDDKAYRSFL